MSKTPRRSKYIDKAVVAALRDIKVLEAAIAGYEFAQRVMSNRHYAYGRSPEWKADESLRLHLWRQKSEAQARALMFGNLTTNDELRKAALKAATEFIMLQNGQIMGYLSIENVPPSRWSSDVEHEFRAEIRAAVREQLGIDPDEDDRSAWGVVQDEGADDEGAGDEEEGAGS